LWNGALSAIPALTTSSSIGPLAARASSKAAPMRARVGDVALDRAAADPLGDRLDRLEPATGDGDLRPGAVQVRGRGGADPGPAAGDQGMAALEPVCSRPWRLPFRFAIGRTAMRWQGGGP
jgi:hypothetical protein